MIHALNPQYEAPSARVLSGRLLDKHYATAKTKLDEELADVTELTITSDGWTNLRGDQIVNFIIKAPGKKATFYKSIDTTGISQTGVAIADAIGEEIEEIGVHKIVAVVTDNANVMKSAWKELESRYPTISFYGCAAHGVNLLIKDIVSLPQHSRASAEMSRIIQFINNHHIAHAKYQEKMKEASVTHKLSAAVKTRWYTEHTSACHLKQARILLMRMANEDWELLGEIGPKENTDRAIALMKNTDFWDRVDNLIEDIELPSITIGEYFKMRVVLLVLLRRVSIFDRSA